MAGITDLATLLKTMEPSLSPEEFVYCTVPTEGVPSHLPLNPLCIFHEAEGTTLILPTETAKGHGLSYGAPMRCITLTVHSALEAVGLTAAFATALTREGISANVVAAYYHDHIFVPSADAERAVAVLKALSAAT
jgi:hypothetical protein